MENWINDIHVGDAVEVLSEMPESSVHMAMCSPPYFGLRDYGADGQIGLEDSLDEYISELVNVGDELKRVLRDDGSWWLNLGDSYDGSKNKSLVPHQVAMELQESGWIVRCDVVWEKPNAMPESVKDRFSETKEFVFHLVRSDDYYFDLDSVRVPHKTNAAAKMRERNAEQYNEASVSDYLFSPGERPEGHPKGKNPGDVFRVPTDPYPAAHFAVYPPELCEKPIEATCPDDGIVLDPFMGAGTTGLVADRLGRDWVGIDISEEYVNMAKERIYKDKQTDYVPENAEEIDGTKSILDAV